MLDFVKPYLAVWHFDVLRRLVFIPGGFNSGEQRAFREWLDRNPHLSAVELMRYGWCGNSFVIHDATSIRPSNEASNKLGYMPNLRERCSLDLSHTAGATGWAQSVILTGRL